MLSVSTSLGGLEQYIAKLSQINAQTISDQISQILIDGIKESTAASQTPEGVAYIPYTPGYAKYRQKKGLSTIPDLKVTGKMLDSLVVQRNGIITTISDTDNPGKVEGVSNLRTFIGISAATRIRLIQTVRDFIGRILE